MVNFSTYIFKRPSHLAGKFSCLKYLMRFIRFTPFPAQSLVSLCVTFLVRRFCLFFDNSQIYDDATQCWLFDTRAGNNMHWEACGKCCVYVAFRRIIFKSWRKKYASSPVSVNKRIFNGKLKAIFSESHVVKLKKIPIFFLDILRFYRAF